MRRVNVAERQAPGEDRSRALALVNTRVSPPGGPRDDLADPAAARDWLAGAGLLGPDAAEPLDAAQAARLRAFRESVRALLAARAAGHPAAPPDLAAVNGELAAPALVWDADGPRRVQRSTGGPVDRALSALAADTLDLLTGPDAPLLTACRAHGCVRLFLRTHAARHWCSTRCGDRVRAARHYARRREGS